MLGYWVADGRRYDLEGNWRVSMYRLVRPRLQKASSASEVGDGSWFA